MWKNISSHFLVAGCSAVGLRFVTTLTLCASVLCAVTPGPALAHPMAAALHAEEQQMKPMKPVQTIRGEAENYEIELTKLKGLLRHAQEVGDKKAEADSLFYLGLTRQQQAEAKGWSLEARPFAAEAERYYREVLVIRPDSAATLNNLAQLYLRTGREREAAEYMKKAAAVVDPRQAFYAKNYADVLSHQGDWRSAQQYYTLAARAQPENREAHEKLVSIYLESDPDGLANYLWELVNSGRVLRAQEAAISGLGRARLSTPARVELLTIITVSLGAQAYDPAEFERSATASRLAELATDPAIGPGAGELVLLHAGNMFEPSRFPWWGSLGHDDRDPQRGVWPRDAFRQLIRTLGDWYHRNRNDKLAEQYYLLAVQLGAGEVDPEACLALAELYAEKGRVEAINQLLERYSPSLFHGKGMAYRNSHIEKIYTYHQTLGVIYSYVGQWGNSGNPASAIFQLEHARDAARQLGRSPEPRHVSFLATAYEKTKQTERSLQLRLSAAEELVQKGDKRSAREVLKPIEESSRALSQEDKQRFEKLQIQIKQEKIRDGI